MTRSTDLKTRRKRKRKKTVVLRLSLWSRSVGDVWFVPFVSFLIQKISTLIQLTSTASTFTLTSSSPFHVHPSWLIHHVNYLHCDLLAIYLYSRPLIFQLPNVDSKTGERDPAVPLKVIVKYGNVNEKKNNKPLFGVYAVPKGKGVVRVGDGVRVRKWVEDD